jgi:hypothetical protein
MKTIGIIEVVFFAAHAGTGPPRVKITFTLLPTRSAASSGSRSCRPSTQRYSVAIFCPST